MAVVVKQGRPIYLPAIWAVVVAFIVSYLVVLALSVVARLPLPVEFMYGESIVLDLTRRVARGEPLYPSPDHLPLVVTAYTPIYYLLVGNLQRLFGDSYLPGRVVSIVSTVGAALALALSVGWLGKRWQGALLAAGFFLTQNMTVLLWGPLHRVDLLALFLTLSGLALVTVGRARVAAVLFVMAVLTKQSYLVAPLAVLVSLWPDRREMLWFGGIFAVCLGGAVAVASWLTDGWFLWHTVLANANPFDLDNLRAMLDAFLHFNGVPLLAAAMLFTVPSRPGERLWRCYFVGTLLTLPGFGKVGASSNYWLEVTAATAACIGLLSDRLITHPDARARFTEGVLAVLVAGSLLIPITGYQSVTRETLELIPERNVAGLRGQFDLAPVVAAEHGAVLTDEPALAVAAGQPVAYEFVIFDLLATQGHWDERPIVEAIEAKRFSLVILTSPVDGPPEDRRWTLPLIAALTSSYAPAGSVANYWLYRPIGGDAGGQVAGSCPTAGAGCR
jgi:hypothetical protein